jgi:hypothetical protein
MVMPFMEQINNKSIMIESNRNLTKVRLQLTLGGRSREGSNASHREKDERDGG